MYKIIGCIKYGGRILQPGEENSLKDLNADQINSLIASGMILKIIEEEKPAPAKTNKSTKK